ncbi:helix-turn-helix domain-containing protein, partial [Abyssisolibacter fermentans]|uniref:helix-turn-helix domain-containing protein n=1 Tax=Abyssisolibacter fermentans TaxID=1766203 RepID=UPI00138F6FC4
GAADKYQIKYALVYQWVQKYKKDSVKGLEHKKRGPKTKSIVDENSLSEIEKLKLELEKERKLREHAELTVEILKKKEELEKKLRSRK